VARCVFASRHRGRPLNSVVGDFPKRDSPHGFLCKEWPNGIRMPIEVIAAPDDCRDDFVRRLRHPGS
jgi:hypothetical protein